MNALKDIPLSMLDLVQIREGGTIADALAITLRTARRAEALGFKRYWLAEHHNLLGIASSATAVLVGYEFSDFTERAAVRGLAGSIAIGGKLPVTLPGMFPFGHGMVRSGK